MVIYRVLVLGWYCRPHPEDQINRKPDDRKITKKANVRQNSTVLLRTVSCDVNKRIKGHLMPLH